MACCISSRSRAAISDPIPSAVLSTALAVTARSASSFICRRPRYVGRSFGVLYVEFDIGRELAAVAVRAQAVGTRHVHLASNGEQRYGAQFLVLGLSTPGLENCRSPVRVAAPARCMAERATISMASRSTRPVLRYWRGVFAGPQPADLLIHFDEIVTDLLKFPELTHFPLGFPHSRGRRKSLCYCFVFAFMSQA